MNKIKLDRMVAGIDSWQESFGTGMEFRGKDGMSWYDLSVNCNSGPCEKTLAIIVTSWMGQLKWLRAVLSAYRLSGAFVILAYDNPFYAFGQTDPSQANRCLPNPEHYLRAHAVVTKHITYDSDKRNGWFWDVRYAQGILRSFPNIKHVYLTNGDCMCEKPGGFKDVIDLLGDEELMAGQSNDSVIHTADVLFKTEAFHSIFDYMYEIMRVPVIGSRSPEQMLNAAVRDLGIRVKHAPIQPLDPKDGTLDCYARYGQDSTWRRLLGFRNLFAEQETAWNLGFEPLPVEYVDRFMDWLYFGGEEKETICRFYETGDRRHLMRWWDIGEESDYNRWYAPLEHYGAEPIYGKTAGIHRI